MKNGTIMLAWLMAIGMQANAQWTEPSPVAWNSQNVYGFGVQGTNIFAGTGSAGVSLSTNNGNSWTAVNNGLTSTGIGSFAVIGTSVFAGGDSVFVTTNNGTTWGTVSSGLTNTTVNALLANGTNLFAGTNAGVFLSTNNGGLWTAADAGFTRQVTSFTIVGANIFAGAPNRGVYVSANNGASWTHVNNGLMDTDVLSLATSGTNVFAGTSGGVFLSTNNGGIWTAVNIGLKSLKIYALLVNGTTVFAGTDSGVFYSRNMGTSWTSFNTGFPANTAVQALAVSGTSLFAGIRHDPYGVWRRPLSQASGLLESSVGHSLRLYPNPTSNIVHVDMSGAEDVERTVSVTNITGTLVKSVTIGPYNDELNVAELQNGVYIVAIRSKDFTGTRKLIVQR